MAKKNLIYDNSYLFPKKKSSMNFILRKEVEEILQGGILIQQKSKKEEENNESIRNRFLPKKRTKFVKKKKKRGKLFQKSIFLKDVVHSVNLPPNDNYSSSSSEIITKKEENNSFDEKMENFINRVKKLKKGEQLNYHEIEELIKNQKQGLEDKEKEKEIRMKEFINKLNEIKENNEQKKEKSENKNTEKKSNEEIKENNKDNIENQNIEEEKKDNNEGNNNLNQDASNNKDNTKNKKKSKNKKLKSESKELLEAKKSKLQNELMILEQKTESQILEDFYIFLELDDTAKCGKKMIGYTRPFAVREDDTRNPKKNVKNPIKFNNQSIMRKYEYLLQRKDDIKKEKELNLIKEQDIKFEERKRKFNREIKKLEKDYDSKIKTDNYIQIRKNEEDYLKEKNSKLTWKYIQSSDYNAFLLNDERNININTIPSQLKDIFNDKKRNN